MRIVRIVSLCGGLPVAANPLSKAFGNRNRCQRCGLRTAKTGVVGGR